MKSVSTKKQLTLEDLAGQDSLEHLRQKIDRIDHGLITLLVERTQVVKQIAHLKRKRRLSPLQPQRMKKLLQERMQKSEEVGLRADFARRIFQCIHDESVKVQEKLLETLKVAK